jgi:hypothetical protein
MKMLIYRILLPALLLAAIAPARASLLDVTNASQVTLGTNDSLLFYITEDLTSAGHESVYPGEIEMTLAGMPLGGPVAPIPGTSGVYMPGILFNGAIEPQDGGISIPLIDPDAARLGLPSGDMLLTPGSIGGGSYSEPIDLLSAEVTLSPVEAAALFASGEVVIDLYNAGAPISFGYPGSSIASDFTASMTSPDGSQSVGGRVMQVQCVTAPEPSTMGLLIIGLSMMCMWLPAMRRNRRLVPVVCGRGLTRPDRDA